MSEFSNRESETLKLSQEKETLSATTQTLQDSLREIENDTLKFNFEWVQIFYDSVKGYETLNNENLLNLLWRNCHVKCNCHM